MGDIERAPMPRARKGAVTGAGVQVLRASQVLTGSFVDALIDANLFGFNKVAIAMDMTTGSVAGGLEMKVEWSDNDTDYRYEAEAKISGVFRLEQERIYAFKGGSSATAYARIFLIDVLGRDMRASFKSDQTGNFATLAVDAWGVRD